MNARILCAVTGIGLLAGAARAQITVNAVTNAASYIYTPLPNSSIAQGSFFVILGSGAPGPSATAFWGTYPLPVSLGGTSITVTVGGAGADVLRRAVLDVCQ